MHFVFHRPCSASLGKLDKVKTTAEELEAGIPAKLMFTQTRDTFLRFELIFF
jgi:hypothetical protein